MIRYMGSVIKSLSKERYKTVKSLCHNGFGVSKNHSHSVVNLHKKILKDAGLEHIRFHDLRHTYAVNSLKSGDDIKTVQENLGHQTAAFTLDVYAHATNSMKHESANRMDQYIHNVTKP